MILGLAHLTVGATDALAAAERWTSCGWQQTEAYEDVPSAPQKWPLLSRRAERHDLILLRGAPMLEVVSHATGAVDTAGRIGLEDGVIRVRARHVGKETDFFAALGFQPANDGTLVLSSRFPTWGARLAVDDDADAPLDPPLDLEGFTCLAFYATDLAGDRDRLLAAGGRDATEIFGISLGERTMSVLMLRSPEGTIVELIKIKGR